MAIDMNNCIFQEKSKTKYNFRDFGKYNVSTVLEISNILAAANNIYSDFKQRLYNNGQDINDNKSAIIHSICNNTIDVLYKIKTSFDILYDDINHKCINNISDYDYFDNYSYIIDTLKNNINGVDLSNASLLIYDKMIDIDNINKLITNAYCTINDINIESSFDSTDNSLNLLKNIKDIDNIIYEYGIKKRVNGNCIKGAIENIIIPFFENNFNEDGTNKKIYQKSLNLFVNSLKNNCEYIIDRFRTDYINRDDILFVNNISYIYIKYFDFAFYTYAKIVSFINEYMDSIIISTEKICRYVTKNNTQPVLDNNKDEIYESTCLELIKIYNECTNSITKDSIRLAILEDAAKQSPKEFIAGLGQKISNLIQRFITNVSSFITNDKKFFDDNEQKVKGSEFKFPSQGEVVNDWQYFNIDILSKKIDLPKFNPSDTGLMEALSSDEEFAKLLYKAVGINEDAASKNLENKEESTSFMNTIKGAFYTAPKGDKKISELQNEKDKMFDFCKEFVKGKDGNIIKNIQSANNELNAGKAAAEKAVADAEQQQSSSNDSSKPADNSNQDTQQQTQSTENNNNSTQESSIFDMDLSYVFGVSETSILDEIGLPKITDEDREKSGSKSDASNMKNKLKRYYVMCGNLIGAQMSSAQMAYKQYRDLFKWAIGK